MSMPLFFPPATYVPGLTLRAPISLRELCARAGVECRASGSWTERQIELVNAVTLKIAAAPGDWGEVRLELPRIGKLSQARLALAALAYGLHDLVAKESIRGAEWARVTPPRGRPKTGQALTNRERQRRYRAKNRAKYRAH
jgi:hypothetical protein